MSRPLIPAFVLTGFLGAGKTTLLNRLVRHPDLADTAVVINEYGDAGLDHLLVEKSGDGVVLLASGCLCCSLRGDLLDTLADLAARRAAGSLPPFARVVIETTGLAHPTPVLQTLLAPQLIDAGYALAAVIAVADAQRGGALLDQHAEAVAQLAVADHILLGKADLVGDTALFVARLRALNPTARVTPVLNFGAPDLLAAPVLRPTQAVKPRPFFSAHDASIASFTLATAKTLEPYRLAGFLDELRERHGEGLLRLKGLAKLSDDPSRPVLIQGVQHILHPPERLPAWPDGDEHTRFVLIGRDLDRRRIEDLFVAFIGDVRPDAPDREAITNNPLAL